MRLASDYDGQFPELDDDEVNHIKLNFIRIKEFLGVLQRSSAIKRFVICSERETCDNTRCTTRSLSRSHTTRQLRAVAQLVDIG